MIGLNSNEKKVLQENRNMTESEINEVEAKAKSELLESREGETDIGVQKTNPNKDLIPQRVKLPGLGYVEMIGTQERDEVMNRMQSMIFKIQNLAFAIDSIDIENGTFSAKLMNYHPGIIPEPLPTEEKKEEVKEESQEQ